MYLVLHGESLRPATNGPAGAPPRPLPECFKDKDDRERGGGPRGTVSVAKFGNVCQSCHLNRYVAAGSILFRPFSYSGKLYKPTPSFETIDGELWADAKTESWSHSLDDGSKAPVDQEFLETILSQRTLPTCIETPAGMKQVQSVNDLAAELLSDKPAVLKGFARHAHRAFLSSMTISDELLHRFSNRKTNLNNTIENLVAEYFSSETFACSTHAP